MRADRQEKWQLAAWLFASGPLFTLIFGHGLVVRLRHFDPDWTPESFGSKVPDQDFWMNAFATLGLLSILGWVLVVGSVAISIFQWKRLSWSQRLGPVCVFVGLLAVLLFVDRLPIAALVWHLD